MKLCDTCIYRNNVEQLKPCIIYRDDCEYYEKERDEMKGDLISLEDAIETIASADITDGTEPVFSGKQVIGLLKDLDTINPLDKIKAEIDRQHKWLLQAGYTAYNIDIAFDTIKAVMAESEDDE